MSTVEPSLAGPKRPQDRIRLSDMKSKWLEARKEIFGHPTPVSTPVECDGEMFDLKDGNVVDRCNYELHEYIVTQASWLQQVLVAKNAHALGLNS